ncbi:MAG TPA: adenylosuccinate synthase [Candidatus Aminicenantes bacterium]|nr:adenylosuccinate synthase [Candidatus Aminicenantes bacterium]
MNLLVMGLQWGDEGKGKAIDYLAKNFDVVVRYQGGHNAGHTVYYGDQKVILHLLPSGVFSPHTASVIGNGVVVNPLQLVDELRHLQSLGVDAGNFWVSHRAPLIMPFHQKLDIVFEQSRYHKIGTTRRGIGPAYEDLAGRRALFVGDLLNSSRFRRKAVILNEYYNRLVQAYGAEGTEIEEYMDAYMEAGKFLRSHITDTAWMLNRRFREGQSILFEGAQGALLDIHHGTYPFVTSSNPTVGGVFTGTGLPVQALGRITGIAKAYATRVGEGPFPSELAGSQAEWLREKGGEFGATTGRPRRVGWLDLVALRYAVMINGVDSLFLTKLDVLDGLDSIPLVHAYRSGGREVHDFDPSVEFLEEAEPLVRELPGWNGSVAVVRDYGALPTAAQEYIRVIEEAVGVPVDYVSVGSGRDQTIKRKLES